MDRPRPRDPKIISVGARNSRGMLINSELLRLLIQRQDRKKAIFLTTRHLRTAMAEALQKLPL